MIPEHLTLEQCLRQCFVPAKKSKRKLFIGIIRKEKGLGGVRYIRRLLHKSHMLNKVKRLVDTAFLKKDPKKSLKHFERTIYWAQQLNPDADEAVLIAAYAHDIARAFAKEDAEFWNGKELNDADYLDSHQKESARMIVEFLEKEGYDKEKIKRVEHMVRYHEVGGSPESDLIKDADSISYLEVNAPKHVEKFGRMFGKEKTKTKFDFMFNRISSEKAKKVAEPMYKKVVEMLEES